MDLFARAKTIHLISHRDKYLVAEDDRVNVSLGRDPSAENAVWMVELVADRHCIRLRSCYGTYLTALSAPFLPGVTAKRVVQARDHHQTCDPRPDEWEPFRDGMQVRLKSLWGNFLRPNGGLPPWRNAITHDVPHRSRTRDKILWDVEVVERCVALEGQPLFCRSNSVPAAMEAQKQNELRRVLLLDDQVDRRSVFTIKCCW